VLIRNNAPVFGANGSVYPQPGTWQLNLSARNLVSNDHYNGTAEQHERQERENYITNRQNLFDIGVTRQMTSRVSATVAVPFVYSAWAFRSPASPLPGPRVEEPQWGRGLGDIIASARTWIFAPASHAKWNVGVGGGVKFPTGNEAYQDSFLVVRGAIPGILGAPVPNFVEVREKQNVDQSVNPGDGGWGAVAETQAFWHVKRAFLFASASYLANPQDTNGTPSIAAILGAAPQPGTPNFAARTGENSIPDQYLLRAGGSAHVWKGFSASLSWRMEGLKVYDLFGESHGFRRPGTSMFIEPGVAFSFGQQAITFNVPLAYYYNRHPNPITNNAGDATFPRQIFLTSYSVRLGAKRAAVRTQTTAPDEPTSLGTPSTSDPSPAYRVMCPSVGGR
jgi:hypothetical protein